MTPSKTIIQKLRERMKVTPGDFVVCATNDPDPKAKPFGLIVGATLKAIHLIGDPSLGVERAEGVLVALAFDRDKLRALRDDCNELLGEKTS